jgi:hypothetical protein
LALEVLVGCVPLHIDAESIHSRWEAGKSNDLEGKVVFAEGPHPAEPERKWEELAEDDTRDVVLDRRIADGREDRRGNRQDGGR